MINFIKVPEPSCLDSAYERLAIDQGMNKNPIFPENVIYLEMQKQKLIGEVETHYSNILLE